MTKRSTPEALGDRVAALLTAPGRTAAEVAALAAEVREAHAAARRDADAARAEALDPRLTAAKVASLRAKAEDAAFEADRLAAAAEALAAEAEALDRAEAEAARLAAYEGADAQAQAVADRIAAEYPDLSRRLMDLIGNIVTATQAVVAVNRDLPEGRAPLQAPEGRARGFTDTAGTMHRFEVARIVNMWVAPFAAGPSFAWPVVGGQPVRATAVNGFEPYALWPSAADVARGLDAVAAASGARMPTFDDHPPAPSGPSAPPSVTHTTPPDDWDGPRPTATREGQPEVTGRVVNL